MFVGKETRLSGGHGSALRLSFFCASVALLIRWANIYAYGVDVPFSDQWDHEIYGLLKSYVDGSISWRDFFLPANEHRIVLTRVLNLGIFILSGQTYNNLTIMYAQSVISVVPLFVTLLLLAEEEISGLFFVCVSTAYGACFSYENLLWGYQSQVYFALAATSFAIAWSSRDTIPAVRVGICILAQGANMASAMFTGASASFAALWEAWRSRKVSTVLKAALFIGLSALTSTWIWHNPGHAILRASSIGALLQTVTLYLKWPTHEWLFDLQSGLSSLPVWIGGLVYSAQIIFRKGPTTRFERYAVMWTLWTTMTVLAAAFARSGHIPNRYCDYLVIELVVLSCAAWLAWRKNQAPKITLAWGMTTAAVLATFSVGIRPTLLNERNRRVLAQEILVDALAAEQTEQAIFTILNHENKILYPDDHRLAMLVALPETRFLLRHLKKRPK